MSDILKPPKVIFFDWDGTLVDSFELIQSAHDYALASMGLPSRSGHWFQSYFGQQRDFIYNSIYGSQASEAQEHFEVFVDRHHTQLLSPMPGAQALLDCAYQAGVPMCVVSNKRTRFIHPEVAHLGWDSYFASVIGSGDAPEDKPSAVPVYEAVKKASLNISDFSETWFVGDTEVDLMTARNAGALPILLEQPGFGQISEKSGIPVKMLKNCREIQDYLLQTLQN
jgi:phosphoglycolate phosphatase-like HAD superfamily hydrolase